MLAYMPWWMWLVVGLVLLVGEVLTPGGFFIFFFGVAAIAVGIFKAVGLEMTLVHELLVFSVLSVLGLAVFRKPLQQKFKQLTPEILADELVGEVATAAAGIEAGGEGKVELRGTAWNATNGGETAIQPGGRCVVEKVIGLTLTVRAK